jgi:hypothetical protein
MRRGFVVIAGLPASGKSVLGAAIAPSLDLPLLDKDDFLEGLYGRDGVGDAIWRTRLSRQSDDPLRSAALGSEAARQRCWCHSGGIPGKPVAALQVNG